VALSVFGAVALFATGVGPRPAGSAWDLGYDLVLYNAVYLLGAAGCWRGARDRAAGGSAGRWLAAAFLASAAGNVVYTVLLARLAEPMYPSVADLLYLLYYPLVYVAVARLARDRVARVRPSMWLDGLIGALGAAALAIAVLLAPALQGMQGGPAELVTNLAYPVADVLLLALLVGVGGVLGLRSDRAMLLMAAGLVCNLCGDIVYLDLEATGRYVEGGPLDLTWLLSVACISLAVRLSPPHTAPPPGPPSGRSALVDRRVLAVPVL